MMSARNIQFLLLVHFLILSSYWLDKCNAARNTTNQRVRSFRCVNGNSIFPTWFCDGINDCGDASDESYGCDTTKCGISNFTCVSDSRCFPVSIRCNHVKDCADGSDEEFCDHEPVVEDCDIKKGKYLCSDKKKCIDLHNVCDEETHCFDGSDEGPKCDDYDHETCNVCYHACYRTPTGPYCFFNQDQEEYNDIHRDISSCPANKNNCDQKCVTYKEHVQCSCEENFIPQYTLFQNFFCEEKEKAKNMLVYTVKGAIRGIRGYSNSSVLIKEYEDTITAITAANEYVYWSGLYDGSRVIAKTSFKGDDTKVIVSEGIGEITAMDADWRTRNIYFIDNVKKQIAVCTDEGERCIKLHTLDNNATSITLAPREGHMFWSMRDEENGFVIMKSEMNGQGAYNFINEGLGDIFSIAADEAAEKLYWLDSTRRKIEVIRFSGDGRKVFKSDVRMNYASITINARFLYWNVINGSNIYYTGGTRVQPKSALNGTETVLSIYGYSHSEKQTKMAAPCSWGCKNGICLIHNRYFNKSGSDCICSNASEILPNKWCREDAESFFTYHYDDHYFYPRESPHYGIRVTIVVLCIIVFIVGTSFFLYYKGVFHNLDVFRHVRF